MCPFGSRHPGGANFALSDGSARFVTESVTLTILQQYCVRNEGAVADPSF
jgi:prepilin-type processing-associated H-X9-DG protein